MTWINLAAGGSEEDSSGVSAGADDGGWAFPGAVPEHGEGGGV